MMKTILLFTFLFYSLFSNAQWQCHSLDSVKITGLSTAGARIFAGSTGGVYVSEDFGDNWSFMPVSPFYDVKQVVANGPTLFAASNNGLRRSENNGSSWLPVNALINFSVQSICLSGSDIFTASLFGVHRSGNNGLQWNVISNGLPPLSGAEVIVANGSNLFAVGDSTVFISTNYGAWWSAADTGLNNKKVYCLAIEGSFMFAGTENGMYTSTNNGSMWTAANNGLPNTIVRSIAISGLHIFAATDSGIYFSADNGNMWTSIQSNLPVTGIRNVAICGHKIFVSADDMISGGEVWSRPLLQVTPIAGDEKEDPFGVYPNPASEKLFFSGNVRDGSLCDFYHMNGLRTSLTSGRNVIDISGLAKGYYILHVRDGNKQYSRPIVIR